MSNKKGTFTDPRDGRVYKTVKIGTQVWMAENLNYNVPGSRFYNDDPANGEKYGRLYNRETAEKACPPGWRLPSYDEWNILIDFVQKGCGLIAGRKLKAKNGWNNDEKGNNGGGTDEFGFSALPGGLFSLPSGVARGDRKFSVVGYVGFWWSTTDSCDLIPEDPMGWMYMPNNTEVFRMDCGGDYVDNDSFDQRYDLMSVRCLQETAEEIAAREQQRQKELEQEAQRKRQEEYRLYDEAEAEKKKKAKLMYMYVLCGIIFICWIIDLLPFYLFALTIGYLIYAIKKIKDGG